MPRGNARQKRNAKIAREQPGVHKLNGDIHEARERIADLERALDVARVGLVEAHEAAVRKGVAVHWDILEPRLRTAHDAACAALAKR